MTPDPTQSSVYAVLRVRDGSGEVDIQVGARRYVGTFLYKPKAVSLRDRLYLRLLASDAIDSSGFTRLGIDIAGVVVATDGNGSAPRLVMRGARFTLRVTTVQRGGVDVSPELLQSGRLDEAPTRGRAPLPVSIESALPSLEAAPVLARRHASPKQGTLQARTMNDLVSHLVQEGTAASIDVTGDKGLGGSVFIEGGQVVAAWAGKTRGLEAVLQLATYVGAAFKVNPGSTTVMRNIEEPAPLVLRALASVKPSASVIFTDEPTLREFDRTAPSLSSLPSAP